MAINLVATTMWINPSSQAKSCTMGFTTSGSLEFAACFKERKEAGNRTTAVRFIQAHARNGARLRNPYADRPMRWLGFSHGAMRGCISSPTGIATSSCKAPSALFQGCIPETNARFFARDYEILTLFARFLAKKQVWVPTIPLVGICDHMSANMALHFREGIHDAAKRRRFGN